MEILSGGFLAVMGFPGRGASVYMLPPERGWYPPAPQAMR